MLDEGLVVHVRLAFRFSLAMVKSVERETGRMRGHVLVEYQTTDKPYWLLYRCTGCNKQYTYMQNAGTALAGLRCSNLRCNQPLTYLHIQKDYETPCADGVFQGINTPSCGFPVGVFWNFLGTADLWAHELGHNRHYEHAAEAFGLADRWDSHDHRTNDDFSGSNEKPENTCWDRACLMSYITDVTDKSSAASYDDAEDTPCLCFKCALRNRGWRLVPLKNPPKDLTD
jgi:hypothetical protein